MPDAVSIQGRAVGPGEPVFVIAEIGINHNGDIDVARKLIDAAAETGCDAVKFQKRTPELCVPPEQRDILRETPWGLITYMDYRYKVEFGEPEYAEIDRHCRQRGILWTASCWDEPSVDFIARFQPAFLKISSAALTDDSLLKRYRQEGCPLILSTGMSTLEQVDHAVEVLGTDDLILLHCTSTYPAKAEEINLRCMDALRERYDVPVGYSGHEPGLQISIAAAAVGACCIERHITLDRTMWGSDQAASVEPHGFSRLVRDIRVIETAMGDGCKKVYDSEKPIIRKLRRTSG